MVVRQRITARQGKEVDLKKFLKSKACKKCTVLDHSIESKRYEGKKRVWAFKSERFLR